MLLCFLFNCLSMSFDRVKFFILIHSFVFQHSVNLLTIFVFLRWSLSANFRQVVFVDWLWDIAYLLGSARSELRILLLATVFSIQMTRGANVNFTWISINATNSRTKAYICTTFSKFTFWWKINALYTMRNILKTDRILGHCLSPRPIIT